MLIVQRYGIEQEYTLLQTNVKWPLGWPVGGYPGPQVIPVLLCFISNFLGICKLQNMDLIKRFLDISGSLLLWCRGR